MTTLVLVHGAWHGGWCWSKVANELRKSGDEVFTPTLTGLSERAHLLSPDVGLGTHIQDVIQALENENLSNVILVGHSYSGMVVTAVADRIGGRIARLVYLDAVVPRNGECLFDRSPAQFRTRIEDHARIEGDGWCVPTSVATPKFLGLKRDEDIKWVLPKLTPHPIRTFQEPLQLGPKLSEVSRAYIHCIGDKDPGQPKSMHAEGIDDYYELQTGHDAMVTEPADVAKLLRKLA